MRRLGAALLGALIAVMFVAGALFTPSARAATVLYVGGTGGSLGSLVPIEFFVTPESFLGGAYIGQDFTFVDYPGSLWPLTGPCDPTLGASVKAGVTSLVASVTSASGPVVVAGTSQGAMVIQQAQEQLNRDPTVSSDTTFILIADPNVGIVRGLAGIRIPILDYVPQPLPETRFSTVVVRNQYDPMSDPVTRPWNLLADLNAVMALVYVHSFAQNSDLSTVPPEDITIAPPNSQGGVTTTYFVPTKQLPLTMPLRQLGLPSQFVDGIDNLLRPAIDAGYAPLPCNHSASVAGARKTAAAATSSARRPGSSLRPAAAGTSAPRSRAR